MDPHARPVDEVIHPLTEDECWTLLGQQELGRLAFHLGDEVDIRPINYVVDAPRRRLIFRTAEGDKLLGVVMDSDVAFEIDEITGDHASSVVVHGNARRLEGREADVVEQLPLRPWVPTEKWHVVAIEPRSVTGRTFDLSRPWQHLR